MLKVVLDTNIFVSSFISKAGLPAQILNAWRTQRYVLCVSPAIIAEIQKTLTYPKLQEKYAISGQDILDLIALLEQDAFVVPGTAQVSGAILDDPDDEIFLACALDAGAAIIVSGDHHLLDLGTYQDIVILTAREFVERLSTQGAW